MCERIAALRALFRPLERLGVVVLHAERVAIHACKVVSRRAVARRCRGVQVAFGFDVLAVEEILEPARKRCVRRVVGATTTAHATERKAERDQDHPGKRGNHERPPQERAHALEIELREQPPDPSRLLLLPFEPAPDDRVARRAWRVRADTLLERADQLAKLRMFDRAVPADQVRRLDAAKAERDVDVVDLHRHELARVACNRRLVAHEVRAQCIARPHDDDALRSVQRLLDRLFPRGAGDDALAIAPDVPALLHQHVAQVDRGCFILARVADEDVGHGEQSAKSAALPFAG